MIKNKILLIICLGMATLPLCSTESAEQTKNRKKNTSSWTRSPWLWGGVAFAGAVGAWVYKKYQDYKNNHSQQQDNKNNHSQQQDNNIINSIKTKEYKNKNTQNTITITDEKSYNNLISPEAMLLSKTKLIDDKLNFYLQNKTNEKNFFEKTYEELTQKKLPNNPLLSRNETFDIKYKQMIQKNNNVFYVEKFNNLIDFLIKTSIETDIELVTNNTLHNQNTEQKETLLHDIAQKFILAETYANNLAGNDPFLKYFFSKLLLYYKPIKTLREIKEQEEQKKERENHITKIKQALISKSTEEYKLPSLITIQTLKTYNLCPPLEKPKKDETLSIRIIKNIKINNETMSIVAEGTLDNTIIPCVYSFKKDAQVRTVFQIKSIDQLNLDRNEFNPVGDNCPWISLFNSYCLFNFYTNNNFSNLPDLLDTQQIKNFYELIRKLQQA